VVPDQKHTLIWGALSSIWIRITAVNGENVQQILDRGGGIVGTSHRMASFPFTYGETSRVNHINVA
jgi:hypothetical protein